MRLTPHSACHRYRSEGEWPTYGNDDDRVDGLARSLVAAFHGKLAAQHTYRSAVPTLRWVLAAAACKPPRSASAAPFRARSPDSRPDSA